MQSKLWFSFQTGHQILAEEVAEIKMVSTWMMMMMMMTMRMITIVKVGMIIFPYPCRLQGNFPLGNQAGVTFT